MYVVKVGEFYVRGLMYGIKDNVRFIQDIELSREMMRNFTKELAEYLAEKLNGEVIEMTEDWLKIVNHFGLDEQIKHWFTEVYELVQAIERDDGTLLSKSIITSELADNFNFLKQIQVFYGITDKDIEEAQNYKNKRTLKEIKEG